jgi:Flp pilus assembly protein TadD
LRLDPNLAEAHARLGLELGRQGDDATALEHFAQAVRLKPDLLEARLNLGIGLLKQGRQADAIAEFNEVLRRDPGNQVALKNLQKLGQK